MQIGATGTSSFSAVNSYAQAQATPLPVDAAQGRLQASPVQTQAAVRQLDTSNQRTSNDVKREEVQARASVGPQRDGSAPRPGSLLDIRV